jgi:hypothetical protein
MADLQLFYRLGRMLATERGLAQLVRRRRVPPVRDESCAATPEAADRHGACSCPPEWRRRTGCGSASRIARTCGPEFTAPAQEQIAAFANAVAESGQGCGCWCATPPTRRARARW